MKKMRAVLLAKRKARYRFARQSFGSANVNELGCIKGIRIKEEKNINTILVEKHDPRSQEEFLRNKSSSSRLTWLKWLTRLKSRDRRFVIVHLLPAYQLSIAQSRVSNNSLGHDIIKKCALLATKDYNTQTLTKYRLLDVEKLGWTLYFGIQYYIIFQATCSEGSDTFEAEVVYRRIGKKNLWFGSISVLAVRIRRPGIDWHKGLLKELIN